MKSIKSLRFMACVASLTMGCLVQEVGNRQTSELPGSDMSADMVSAPDLLSMPDLQQEADMRPDLPGVPDMPGMTSRCMPGCTGGKVCKSDAQNNPICECPVGQQDDNDVGRCNPTCAALFPSNACDGHGQCNLSMASGVTGGRPVCMCDEGYVADPSIMRPNCGACDTTHNRIDEMCVLREQCQGNKSCSYHGDCEDETGFIVCECFKGYTGDLCGDCAEGYVIDPEDQGKCIEV